MRTDKATIVSPFNATVNWVLPIPKNDDPRFMVGDTLAMLQRIPDDANVYSMSNMMQRCVARNVISRFGVRGNIMESYVIDIGSDLRFGLIGEMRPSKMTPSDHKAVFAAKSGQSDEFLFSLIVSSLLENGERSELARTPRVLRGEVHM